MEDRVRLAQDPADDLAQTRELRRAAAVGQALQNARHDLNNLFHVTSGWSRLLDDPRSNPEQMREGLHAVITASAQINTLIGGILALEPRPSTGAQLCDLSQRLVEMARGLCCLLKVPEQLSVEIQTHTLCLCDFEEVRATLVDFVLDVRSTLGGDALRLRLVNAERAPEDPPNAEHMELVLERRPRQTGTLEHAHERLCLRFASALGASLPGAANPTEPSARFAPPVSEAPDWSGEAPAQTGSVVVLFVDEHREVRRLAATMLERSGYQLLTACHADEAWATSLSYDGPIQVLCCDARIPGLPAAQLIEKLRSVRPELRVLICASEQPQDALSEYPYLCKPFSYQQLLDAVRLCQA